MESFLVCRRSSHRTLDENGSTEGDPNHSKHVHRTGAPRKPGEGSGSASGGEKIESESSPGEVAWSSGVTRAIVGGGLMQNAAGVAKASKDVDHVELKTPNVGSERLRR